MSLFESVSNISNVNFKPMFPYKLERIPKRLFENFTDISNKKDYQPLNLVQLGAFDFFLKTSTVEITPLGTVTVSNINRSCSHDKLNAIAMKHVKPYCKKSYDQSLKIEKKLQDLNATVKNLVRKQSLFTRILYLIRNLFSYSQQFNKLGEIPSLHRFSHGNYKKIFYDTIFYKKIDRTADGKKINYLKQDTIFSEPEYKLRPLPDRIAGVFTLSVRFLIVVGEYSIVGAAYALPILLAGRGVKAANRWLQSS